MSQPAASPDEFVPFHPAAAAAASRRGTTPDAGLRVVPPAEPAPAFAPLHSSGPPHPHSAPSPTAKPIVTLQREGERISGIRIECSCGQVIDLACSYEQPAHGLAP